MRTPSEGAVYRDEHADSLVECTEGVDPWGKSTRELENEQVWFQGVDDGEKFSIYVDNFQRGYPKVADSVDQLPR